MNKNKEIRYEKVVEDFNLICTYFGLMIVGIMWMIYYIGRYASKYDYYVLGFLSIIAIVGMLWVDFSCRKVYWRRMK